MILDEPAALDPVQRREVLEVMENCRNVAQVICKRDGNEFTTTRA